MVAAIKEAQIDESEGWSPGDPEYGGWAIGGPPRPKPEAPHLDLSTTRFALEALEAAGVQRSDAVWARARRFVESCQNHDRDHPRRRGFCLHHAPAVAEQGRDDRTRRRASLPALVRQSDRRRPPLSSGWSDPPGPHPSGGAMAGRALHPRSVSWIPVGLRPELGGSAPRILAGVRHALSGFGPEIARGGLLRDVQRADGSWSNPLNLMQEDERSSPRPWRSRPSRRPNRDSLIPAGPDILSPSP